MAMNGWMFLSFPELNRARGLVEHFCFRGVWKHTAVDDVSIIIIIDIYLLLTSIISFIRYTYLVHITPVSRAWTLQVESLGPLHLALWVGGKKKIYSIKNLHHKILWIRLIANLVNLDYAKSTQTRFTVKSIGKLKVQIQALPHQHYCKNKTINPVSSKGVVQWLTLLL